MTGHGLKHSSLAVAALVLSSCAGLPVSISDAVRSPRDLIQHAGKTAEKKDEYERCEKLRTTPVGLNEEQAVGQTTALQIIRDGGLTDDGKETAALRALNRLGVALALMSERPSLEWTFGILEDDGVNAFATPGGYIFVTRGLLRTRGERSPARRRTRPRDLPRHPPARAQPLSTAQGERLPHHDHQGPRGGHGGQVHRAAPEHAARRTSTSTARWTPRPARCWRSWRRG